MRISYRIVPGVLAGGLLLAGLSGAFAAAPAPKAHWAAVGGQVSNLAGNTFTLTLNPKAAAKGKTTRTVQVTVASTAKLQARAGTTGSLASGDYAVVVGTRLQTSVTANRVLFSATVFPARRAAALIRARHTIAVLSHRRAAGTVQSSTGTTLAITTKAGKALTFQLTPTTNFRVSGQVSHTAPTFTTGERVVVAFTVDKTTKQFIATAVAVRA